MRCKISFLAHIKTYKMLLKKNILKKGVKNLAVSAEFFLILNFDRYVICEGIFYLLDKTELYFIVFRRGYIYTLKQYPPQYFLKKLKN
jgi:hypothetical protein